MTCIELSPCFFWPILVLKKQVYRMSVFSSQKGPKKAGSSQIGNWLEPKGAMARAILGIP